MRQNLIMGGVHMSNSLLISPHSDDACLFACFTLMREKPLVLTVTSSYIQQNRGENITPDQRKQEDIEAMKILGCSIMFGELRDDILDEWGVKNLVSKFANFDTIYAPSIQGGNKDHDLIGKVAKELFGDKVKQYTTYTPTELYTTGLIERVPSPAETLLKERALSCYRSQITLPTTKPHFDAMKGKPEWII